MDIFSRNQAGRWELVGFSGADAIVEFKSLDFRAPMRDLYEDVDFEMGNERL